MDYRRDVLQAWGERTRIKLRTSLALARSYRHVGIDAVDRFYGLSRIGHALYQQPYPWLCMTEVQATQGLAHFLREDADRIRSFLQALLPTDHAWAALEDVQAKAEVPAGAGRIDLLITGRADGQIWGAVVEVKFGHALKANRLNDYAQHGAKLGLRFGDPGPTGELIVLGRRAGKDVTSRLTRLRKWKWRFVDWATVLRRWERCLPVDANDEEFGRFRRTLWETANA
jgi:hypothetical protein